jgi:hypothetical protein
MKARSFAPKEKAVKIVKGNRGHAIVYVALFITFMFIFVSLSINAGLLTYGKNQGQAAVDAAALGAAAAIPRYNTFGNPNDVYAVAETFNSENTVMNESANIVGATDMEFCTGNAFGSFACESTPANPAQVGGVRVTKSYPAQIYLTGFLDGDSSKDLTVSATAWLGGPGGLSPDLPVAICSDEVGFDPANLQCLPNKSTEFSPNNADSAGWWTPIDFSASSSDCSYFVNQPDEIPYLNLGEEVNLNNGEITSCHIEIAKRFQGCNPNICALDPENEQRKACTAVIPIVNCGGSINQQLPVEGFAAICVTNVQSTPASKARIDGNLKCDVTAANTIGGGPQFGIYADHPLLVK